MHPQVKGRKLRHTVVRKSTLSYGRWLAQWGEKGEGGGGAFYGTDSREVNSNCRNINAESRIHVLAVSKHVSHRRGGWEGGGGKYP